jgi:hypothetical protein
VIAGGDMLRIWLILLYPLMPHGDWRRAVAGTPMSGGPEPSAVRGSKRRYYCQASNTHTRRTALMLNTVSGQ